MSLEDLTDVEHVRARPLMYIGTTGFFGLVHYFVSAVNLVLERSPKWIAVEAVEDGFRIRSDANLCIERNESNELLPFERFRKEKHGLGLDGPMLNALSSRLTVRTSLGEQVIRLVFDRGRLIDESQADGDSSVTEFEFAPDSSIFTVSHFSSYNFDSYFRRISFLNPSTVFSFTESNTTRTYHSPNGIRGMFDCVSSPYQILHKPIHFRHVESKLDLEIVWGYHSWEGDVVWSFINKGRAVEGGTHDQGLAAAFRSLAKEVGLTKRDARLQNGVIAIMSIIYPDAVWEGCLKARIGSKELETMVHNTVVEQSLKWIDSHQGVREQMAEMQTFCFPDMWIAAR